MRGTKQTRRRAYSICIATRLPRFARNDIIKYKIMLDKDGIAKRIAKEIKDG
ncbi:MAG: hypothetical protein JWR50_2565, partial [Mucilaginibacter sp.]|nr:hypothetical protein [Mucilaginibacter sp.]